MTIKVPDNFPTLPTAARGYISKPFVTSMGGAYASAQAHLLGHHLNYIHGQVFGTTEISPTATGSGTYRFLYQAHPNARAVYATFIPRGVHDEGSIDFPGAYDGTPKTCTQLLDDVADPGDYAQTGLHFSATVTPGGFGEITYLVDNLQLHSVVIREVERGTLTGTHKHVDRTYADALRFITDNESASDPRGHKAVFNAQRAAYELARFHYTPFKIPSPAATSPGVNGVWTDVTGWTNLRLAGFPRKGSSTADRVESRVKIYVSAVSGGTWEFRVVGASTSAASSGFTTTGWQPGGVGTLSSGVLWLVDTSATDAFKLQVQRTAGAGSISIAGPSIIGTPVH